MIKLRPLIREAAKAEETHRIATSSVWELCPDKNVSSAKAALDESLRCC